LRPGSTESISIEKSVAIRPRVSTSRRARASRRTAKRTSPVRVEIAASWAQAGEARSTLTSPASVSAVSGPCDSMRMAPFRVATATGVVEPLTSTAPSPVRTVSGEEAGT
jgi:hypothetical protein